ncbi:ferric-chelate reductase [Microdochium nivale]|nr:ferric-chelate reductase [Microdochium nivale]
MSHGGGGNTTQIYYYGYSPRTWPCKSDANTCAYFEELWSGNDRGLLYSGILWALAGISLLVAGVIRRALLARSTRSILSTAAAAEKQRPSRMRAAAAVARHHLLPDAAHFLFGRTTRLQVLILAVLVTYLTIFSFVGMTYAMWPTPVASSPGVWKYQSTLGVWSNRLGILAYAITPFAVLLASRESILSLMTGIPYQSFNFLHRWTGYIILVQSIVHSISWCIVCIGMYGPQPSYAVNWVNKKYMIYGICAQFLIIIMTLLSTRRAIRATGFEFFRKSHYVLALVYIGTCWGHWEYLSDWMLCGIILWFLDRLARIVRTVLLHHQFVDGDWGFHSAKARITSFPDASGYGDVVRLDYEFAQAPWKVGQHYFLCFPRSSVWQSHPFTPLNVPVVSERGVVSHAYVFRAKKGETAKIAGLVANGVATTATITVPVVMQGPYGEHSSEGLVNNPSVNVLAVAGGTGITYVLPVLLELVRGLPPATSGFAPVSGDGRQLHLLWAVRHSSDVRWVEDELAILRASGRVRITVYATRESTPSSVSDAGKEEEGDKVAAADVQRTAAGGQRSSHPDFGEAVGTFVEETATGRTVVVASGPGSMITELRAAVAALNDAAKVRRGSERHDVELREDNRLEW